jgi:hypothetical protein
MAGLGEASIGLPQQAGAYGRPLASRESWNARSMALMMASFDLCRGFVAMSKAQKAYRVWPDKGPLGEGNPRYLHARFLSGSGYTPEPLAPPDGWLETHGTTAFPMELIVGDDWAFLEASEDISPASRIQIAIEVMKGFRHIRDCKRAIIWDTKPEHILIQGFCPPDDVSHSSITFIDLETIFLLDEQTFSTAGEPTLFTLNSIARQQKLMLQAGYFDPEAEVVESLIGYLRHFNDVSCCPSPFVNQALESYWARAINCNFDTFIECLNEIGDHIAGALSIFREEG